MGNNSLDLVLSAPRMTGQVLSSLSVSIGFGLVLLFLFVLLRALLRRQWIAAVVVVLVGAGTGILGGASVLETMFAALVIALDIFVLIRFGVLAAIVSYFVIQVVHPVVLTTNFSAWYAGSTLFALEIVLALTAYAFHTAVAGRPLFTGGFLDE